ncbi:hypothetical protein KHS38_18895 [Mucilaginibacter sp. Bleaf8]|uniref:hypothetical protein n=1 Tax=Mucilaginibacter sp. Bleaf8 TaxID=2834430 RepID=UPI001BCAE717|nr:hypothetical protein [Mucilaginibacter sp. Bleaf8]MBS7566480.1 hypothetical protein [Mucilaginibacter sp. Bleaf8]
MSQKELSAYIKDTGNSLTYHISNRDSFEMAVSVIRPELLGKKIQSVQNARYFLLSFSRHGREALSQVGNINKYAQLNNNLSFNLPQYCRLIVDRKDTVRLANYAFNNTYGLAASNNILLVFQLPAAKKNYMLTIDEIGFGLGQQKFEFDRTKVDNLYQISIIK